MAKREGNAGKSDVIAISTSVDGQTHAVLVNGKIVGQFSTLKEAIKVRDKLEGKQDSGKWIRTQFPE